VVRNLIRRLRPIGLDELGLEAALEQYVDDWRRRLPAVRFDLSLQGDLDDVSETLALALYRLLQEGMTNVSRHAEAEHVEIRVQRTEPSATSGSEVFFSMIDDGRGTEPGTRRGLGLIGMRERIETLGGSLQVTNEPAGGFAIRASIPAVGAEASATA
jgi:signal transduction histidine kinase